MNKVQASSPLLSLNSVWLWRFSLLLKWHRLFHFLVTFQIYKGSSATNWRIFTFFAFSSIVRSWVSSLTMRVNCLIPKTRDFVSRLFSYPRIVKIISRTLGKYKNCSSLSVFFLLLGFYRKYRWKIIEKRKMLEWRNEKLKRCGSDKSVRDTAWSHIAARART